MKYTHFDDIHPNHRRLPLNQDVNSQWKQIKKGKTRLKNN